MGRVNPESMKDWKDGDIVMAADYKQERELLRVAINDNFDRLIKKFIAVNRNGSVKTTTDLNAALNELRFREGDNVILSMDKDTATLTISVEYSQGSVDTPALKDGSVVRAKIANGAVHVEKIADGAVTESKIANNSVTTNKIVNNSVTNAKIANNSVTNAKIANNSVTTEKIQTGAVTEAKIASNAVTTSKIANNSVTTEKIQTGALDGRYYTKQEVNAQLAQKTDRTGDHQGTWHGLRVEDIDPEGFDAARITALEKKLNESDIRDTQLNRGLQIVEADEASPLHLIKVEGNTIINLAPPFTSGDWENVDARNWTIVNPYKIEIQNFPTGSLRSRWKLTVFNINSNTTYSFSANHNGRVSIWRDDGYTNIRPWTTEKSFSFNSGYNDYVEIWIDRNDENTKPVYFENICLVEGSEPQEFVEGIKNLRGLYVKRYGNNLLPPFSKWSYLSLGAEIVDGYTLKYTKRSTGTEHNYVQIPVKGSQYYTFSGKVDVDAGVVATAVINMYDEDGNQVLNHGTGYISNGDFTLTAEAPATASYARIYIYLPYSNPVGSTGEFSDVMLNIGAEPLPFESQNEDYLYADVELASLPDSNDSDVLEYIDGKYLKTKMFDRVELDETYDYTFLSTFTGFKRVRVEGTFLRRADSNSFMVNHDGRILERITASGQLGNEEVFMHNNEGKINIWIPNHVAGWDQSYTPTSEEVKAYFLGWKMYEHGKTPNAPYSSGDKRWCPITRINDPLYTSYVSTIVPKHIADNKPYWKPYRMYYRLESPIVEDVTDKVEGAISLYDGDNLIEVGEGVVVREPVVPFETSTDAWINRTTVDGGILKNRAKEIISVFSDGVEDYGWTHAYSENAFGKVRLYKPLEKYDPNKVYTVTYIAEKGYYTAKAPSINVKYGANIKSSLDTLTQDVADLKTVVSEIPVKYAKRVQGNWIEATLLSGFSGNIRYFKDSFGIVHIVGSVYGGDTSQENVLFILPKGYRPNFDVLLPAWSGYALGAQTAITLYLYHKDGHVKIFNQPKDDHIYINTTIRAGV